MMETKRQEINENSARKIKKKMMKERISWLIEWVVELKGFLFFCRVSRQYFSSGVCGIKFTPCKPIFLKGILCLKAQQEKLNGQSAERIFCFFCHLYFLSAKMEEKQSKWT